MHDPEEYARIVDNADSDALAALRLLGTLLGAPESDTESSRAWAARRLGIPKADLAAVEHDASPTRIAILGHIVGSAIAEYQDVVELGGPGDGEPPTWTPLLLGSDEELMVPGRLIAHFPAGTVAKHAVCIDIDNDQYVLAMTIYADAKHREPTHALMSSLMRQVRSSANPFRGKVLEANVDDDVLKLSVSNSLAAPRESLVLNSDVWAEVDIFLSAATDKRQMMHDLGLGTTRGLLLAGPPGTGKTHLARVIASELVGDFTVIFADAATMRDLIRRLYWESETFGPLVVILEDIDLIVGHRDRGARTDSLADFLAALDGVHEMHEVYTIATTNDVSEIDPAAQRTARFDTIVTIPKPGPKEREAILARYLRPLNLEIELQAAVRAMDGCTGSDVREVVRRAVLEYGATFTGNELADVASSGRWRPKVSTGQYL